MIYVDEAKWKKPNGRKLYAHMVADTLEELHAFALKIGVKRHFFHRTKNSVCHYDITAEQRALAIHNDAAEVSTRELIKRGRYGADQDLRAQRQVKA